MSETFTHEVTYADGSTLSVELPKGVDPGMYDQLSREIDQAGDEAASAGKRGAVARIKLATQLRVQGGMKDKSWKQLVQEPAYASQVSRINAKHGTKKAASNHTVALRENREELEQVLRDSGLLGEDDLSSELDWWYLDPHRNDDKPKTVAEKVVKEVVEAIADEVEDGESITDVWGMCSALEQRLLNLGDDDLGNNKPECLNRVNALIRAAERAKSFVVSSIRSAS